MRDRAAPASPARAVAAAQLWHPKLLVGSSTQQAAGDGSRQEATRKLCADTLTNPRLVSLMLPLVGLHSVTFTAATAA